MDFTKDGFFFSHSYNLAATLQANMAAEPAGSSMPFNNMFVWNEYLTRCCSWPPPPPGAAAAAATTRHSQPVRSVDSRFARRLIVTPANFADCLIGSPIASQCAAGR